MPTFSFPCLNISRKGYSLTLLFLLLPLIFYAQSLTGLWVGELHNDSSTVRKDQSFEIALTEYRGKVYGYSRSEFIVNDTVYYIVKRVKGVIDGDVCEVTDDEIISYNFRGRLDKGIKVTSTFRRNKSDSTWSLDGSWKTNKTKKFYAVSGKVSLEAEKDLNASKIFPHLEELNLANDVAFYKENKEKETDHLVKLVKPENSSPSFQASIPSNNSMMVSRQPDLKRAETDPGSVESIAAQQQSTPVIKKTDNTASQVSQQAIPKENVQVKTAAPDLKKAETAQVVKPQPLPENKPAVQQNAAQHNETIKQPVAEKKNNPAVPDTKKPVSASANTATQTNTVAGNNKPVQSPSLQKPQSRADSLAMISSSTEKPEARKPQVSTEEIIRKAALVEGRKSEFTQEVMFSGDSLQIALYDNGIVDGDTVSLYMNGEVIMARQGLKESAIKKTIYLQPGKDDVFTLVLFAEKLGKYPPNTGLLVVRDGNDIYNLRFSSDFNKSTGIVFRRK